LHSAGKSNSAAITFDVAVIDVKLITCDQERTSTEALRAEDCVTILVCQPGEVTILVCQPGEMTILVCQPGEVTTQLHFPLARSFAVCRQFNMSKYSFDVVKVIPHTVILYGARPHTIILYGARPHTVILYGARFHTVILYGARPPKQCFISYDDTESLTCLKIKKKLQNHIISIYE
jgi:hypothetical protein